MYISLTGRLAKLTVDKERTGVAEVQAEQGDMADPPRLVLSPAVHHQPVPDGVRHVREGILAAIRSVQGHVDRHEESRVLKVEHTAG